MERTAARLRPADVVHAEAKADGTAIAYPGNEDGNTRNSRIEYIFLSRQASNISIVSSQVCDARDPKNGDAVGSRPDDDLRNPLNGVRLNWPAGDVNGVRPIEPVDGERFIEPFSDALSGARILGASRRARSSSRHRGPRPTDVGMLAAVMAGRHGESRRHDRGEGPWRRAVRFRQTPLGVNTWPFAGPCSTVSAASGRISSRQFTPRPGTGGVLLPVARRGCRGLYVPEMVFEHHSSCRPVHASLLQALVVLEGNLSGAPPQDPRQHRAWTRSHAPSADRRDPSLHPPHDSQRSLGSPASLGVGADHPRRQARDDDLVRPRLRARAGAPRALIAPRRISWPRRDHGARECVAGRQKAAMGGPQHSFRIPTHRQPWHRTPAVRWFFTWRGCCIARRPATLPLSSVMQSRRRF